MEKPNQNQIDAFKEVLVSAFGIDTENKKQILVLTVANRSAQQALDIDKATEGLFLTHGIHVVILQDIKATCTPESLDLLRMTAVFAEDFLNAQKSFDFQEFPTDESINRRQRAEARLKDLLTECRKKFLI